jgi:hypothetical protein
MEQDVTRTRKLRGTLPAIAGLTVFTLAARDHGESPLGQTRQDASQALADLVRVAAALDVPLPAHA